MFETKDNPMLASRIMHDRVEPVLRSLPNATDEAAETKAGATARSEPTWIHDAVSDFPDNSVSNRGAIDSRPAQARTAVEYRVLDWLSAIALVVASVAIALALNQHPF
jgi:hypothetical protein